MSRLKFSTMTGVALVAMTLASSPAFAGAATSPYGNTTKYADSMLSACLSGGGQWAAADAGYGWCSIDPTSVSTASGTAPTPSGGTYVVRAGDTMTGVLGMTSNKIVDLADGAVTATSQDAVNGRQLYAVTQMATVAQSTADTALTTANGALQRTGGTMSGAINMGGNAITNMANGSLSATSTDAVTGQQLYTTNQAVTAAQNTANAAQTATGNLSTGLAGVAASFGGGAAYNSSTGAFTQPSYTVQGSTYTDVGSALTALNGAIGAGSPDAVQYDSSAHTNVTLGGTSATSPVGLTNVKAGTLSATSSDAVTGAQLYTTNQAVTAAQGTADTALAAANGALQRTGGTMSGNIDMGTNKVNNLANATLSATSTDAVTGQQLYATNQAVAGLDGRVTTLENNVNGVINGTAGLVQQNPTTRAITVGAATDGTVINVSGTAGTRTVTGLSAGALSATSSDAVTGSQLFDTNNRVSTLEQGAAKTNGALSQVAANLGGGTSYDPATGVMTAPSYALSSGTYNNVGSALSGIDASLASLTASAVQYDSAAKDKVTLGGVGASTPVALTNLKDGVVAAGSRDAVTGNQLYAANQAIAAVKTTADGALQRTGGTMSGAIDMGGNKITGLADGTLAAGSKDAATAGQLFDTNQRVGAAMSTLTILDNRAQLTDVQLTNLITEIDAGQIGLVQQTGGSPGSGDLTFGKSTGGTTVNFAGLDGDRVLTGIKAGRIAADSSDAVNGDQMFSLQAAMRNGVSGLDTRVTNLEASYNKVSFDLTRLQKNVDAGIATTAAFGSMPMSVNRGKVMLAGGTGYRGGQFAVGAGVSYRAENDAMTFNFRVGHDSDKAAVGGGFGFDF